MSETDGPLGPWSVDASEFPDRGSPQEQLSFCLRYAVLAPSGHNTQPWRFVVEADRVGLFADRSRGLSVVDPADRELTIGCGAALYNLRVALRHFGITAQVEILPDQSRPDLLAAVTREEAAEANAEEDMLFAGITARRTTRRTFEGREVPCEVLVELERDAEVEGAWLHVVTGEERDAVARLVAEGDRRQLADKRFRRELASWMRSNGSDAADGMPGYSFGFGDLASHVAPLVIRAFDVGKGQAARDKAAALDGSPLLLVLGTAADDRRAWIAAGQALERLLLRAAASGLTASFLNQPIQVFELRAHLVETVGQSGYPQLLFRIGYGPHREHSPRRPAEAVTDAASPTT